MQHAQGGGGVVERGVRGWGRCGWEGEDERVEKVWLGGVRGWGGVVGRG